MIKSILFLRHSNDPSPSGVKSTRVTIKRSFRAWAIVTVQYSWRGTRRPPLKSRIQRRHDEFNKTKRGAKEVQWPPVSRVEIDAFASFHRYPNGENSFDICSNAGHRLMGTYILETIHLNSLSLSCSRSVFLKKIRPSSRLHSRP